MTNLSELKVLLAAAGLLVGCVGDVEADGIQAIGHGVRITSGKGGVQTAFFVDQGEIGGDAVASTVSVLLRPVDPDVGIAIGVGYTQTGLPLGRRAKQASGNVLRAEIELHHGACIRGQPTDVRAADRIETQVPQPVGGQTTVDASGQLKPVIDHGVRGGADHRATQAVNRRRGRRGRYQDRGDVKHNWIDAQSFLDVKVQGVRHRMDGRKRDVWIVQRDFRTVQGLKMPFVPETAVDEVPQTHKMTVEAMAVNHPLEDSRFTKPQAPVAGSAVVAPAAIAPVPPAKPRPNEPQRGSQSPINGSGCVRAVGSQLFRARPR